MTQLGMSMAVCLAISRLLLKECVNSLQIIEVAYSTRTATQQWVTRTQHGTACLFTWQGLGNKRHHLHPNVLIYLSVDLGKKANFS